MNVDRITASTELQYVSSVAQPQRNIDQVLPNPLLDYIFGFFDLQTQYRVSLVCKKWCHIVKGPTLLLGKILAILKMAQVQCESDTILTSESDSPFRLHGINREFILISKKNDKSQLILIKKNNEQVLVDLRNALSEQEKNHQVLQSQRLLSAFIISEQQFVTVTKEGTIGLWDVSHDKVSCINHVQVFNEKNFQVQINQGFESQINGACVVNNELFVNADLEDEFLATFVFSLDLTIRKNPKNINLMAHNSKQIFCFTEYGYVGRVVKRFIESYLLQEDEFLMQKKKDFVREANTFDIIVTCNDKWLILANYGKVSFKVIYRVIAVDTLEKVFEFEPDYGQLTKTLKYSYFRKLIWLCDDFLIILIGDEIKLYCIPSKLYLTSLSLKGLLKESLPINYRPLLNVSIQSNQIHLLIQDGASSVKHVKYDIDFAVDDKIQRIRPKRIEIPKIDPPKPIVANKIQEKSTLIWIIEALFKRTLICLQYVWAQLKKILPT